MNNAFWGNIISGLSHADFSIRSSIANESDYDQNVVFVDPSKKPTWAAVDGGKNAEQWKTVRFQRKVKLELCDWTQLDDVPLTNTELLEWQTYRQALRDITTQSDPFNITWPTEPS